MKIADREKKYLDYKNKWVGKSVKDGPYIQCVSLGKHYAKECYGVTLPSFGGSAYSGYENKSNTFNEKWKQVPYVAGMIPIVGDLIFWKPTKSNPYGHIAICGTNSTLTQIHLLEQNYVAGNSPHFGKGTGPASITERKRGYNGFAGSWRFMGA